MVCLKANCLTICGRKVYFCLYRHLENVQKVFCI